MKLLAILLALATVLAAGCRRKPSYELDAAAEAALRQRSDECARAVQSAQAARFAACFADDAALMAPGLQAGRGPEDIRAELERWMGRPGFRLALTRMEIGGVQGREGNAVGMEYGRYELEGPDGKFSHTYTIRWVREPKGEWRADLFLLDVQEPAQSTP